MQAFYVLPLLWMLLAPFGWLDDGTSNDGTTPATTVDQAGDFHAMDGDTGYPPPPPPGP